MHDVSHHDEVLLYILQATTNGSLFVVCHMFKVILTPLLFSLIHF